jgi:hypothetical protein
MSEWEDRAAIEELQTLFSYAADRGDYALLRALYTDDAVDDHGGYSGPVDGYIAWVKETHEAYELLSHICGRPLIALDGDTAESEMKSHVYMRLKGPPATSAFVVTRSFDKYRRTPQGWRFTSRVLCADWFGPSFPSPGTAGALVGTMGRDDPVYREAPKVAARAAAIAKGFAALNAAG